MFKIYQKKQLEKLLNNGNGFTRVSETIEIDGAYHYILKILRLPLSNGFESTPKMEIALPNGKHPKIHCDKILTFEKSAFGCLSLWRRIISP